MKIANLIDSREEWTVCYFLLLCFKDVQIPFMQHTTLEQRQF